MSQISQKIEHLRDELRRHEHLYYVLDTPAIAGSGYEADAPRYPATLAEATVRFAESKVARELFGDAFVDHFASSREWEWRKSLEAVTDWELKRYFEVI